MEVGGGSASSSGEVLFTGLDNNLTNLSFEPSLYSQFNVYLDDGSMEQLKGPFEPMTDPDTWISSYDEKVELRYKNGSWSFMCYTNDITKIIGYK